MLALNRTALSRISDLVPLTIVPTRRTFSRSRVHSNAWRRSRRSGSVPSFESGLDVPFVATDAGDAADWVSGHCRRVAQRAHRSTLRRRRSRLICINGPMPLPLYDHYDSALLADSQVAAYVARRRVLIWRTRT